jgi:hypothetical protein
MSKKIKGKRLARLTKLANERLTAVKVPLSQLHVAHPAWADAASGPKLNAAQLARIAVIVSRLRGVQGSLATMESAVRGFELDNSVDGELCYWDSVSEAFDLEFKRQTEFYRIWAQRVKLEDGGDLSVSQYSEEGKEWISKSRIADQWKIVDTILRGRPDTTTTSAADTTTTTTTTSIVAATTATTTAITTAATTDTRTNTDTNGNTNIKSNINTNATTDANTDATAKAKITKTDTATMTSTSTNVTNPSTTSTTSPMNTTTISGTSTSSNTNSNTNTNTETSSSALDHYWHNKLAAFTTAAIARGESESPESASEAEPLGDDEVLMFGLRFDLNDWIDKQWIFRSLMRSASSFLQLSYIAFIRFWSPLSIIALTFFSVGHIILDAISMTQSLLQLMRPKTLPFSKQENTTKYYHLNAQDYHRPNRSGSPT